MPPSTLSGLVMALAVLALPWSRRAAPTRERYEIDPAASHLVLRVGRAGLFGFFGHEHGVLATEWSGRFCVDPAQPTGATGEVSVPVASLRIDTPEGRRLAGLDPDGGPGPEDREALQRKMLSADVLDAARYRTIELLTNSVGPGPGDSVLVEADLSLHGRTQKVRFPVALERDDAGALRLAGRFRIRQTAFGIRPESKGGVVSVADELEIRFDLVSRPHGRGC